MLKNREPARAMVTIESPADDRAWTMASRENGDEVSAAFTGRRGVALTPTRGPRR
jgi:hypothetical protein